MGWSEYDEGLIDTYRRMNSTRVASANGFKEGDIAYWKKSNRVVERVWGKLAGTIVEIRKGRSGPTIIQSGGVGVSPIMYHAGPPTSVALLRSPDGRAEFSDVRDLKRASSSARELVGINKIKLTIR